MSDELSDTPLVHPEDDLLGVAPSAEILAGRLAAVQPPFTAGVYGEWGSGKTTFVSFVAEYLERLAPRPPSVGLSTLFVPFSAWQYKTADEIWRALILTIARKILNIPDPAGQPVDAAPPRLGLWERITAVLGTDAFVLRHEQASPDAQSRYAGLITKLDASLYGGISKSTPAIDTTETIIAVTKSVVAAISGVSPMVAAIRGVFGFNTDVDLSKLVDKGQNESTRQRIESMEEFKTILRELFNGEARKVFVFVDDLDRCMPDAALDLLEAIKIFLQSTPCVFVVAADEALIGQGLRMRFRDVVDPAGSGDVNAFMNKKGREYFEKIIQLPVHLPRPGADEIHRFIGARFAKWFAASDLIDAAIGGNPRRLKQYCNRLEYRQLISQPAGARPMIILDKLVALRCHDQKLLQHLCELACSGLYASTLAEVERCADGGVADPTETEAVQLYQGIAARDLLDLLREAPKLSEVGRDDLLTIANFSDVRPDAAAMFHTTDPVFMRLVDLTKQGPVVITKLMLDDFCQLAVLAAHFPTLWDVLHDLAGGASWTTDMLAIELFLSDRQTVPSYPLAASFAQAVMTAVMPDGTALAAMMLTPPRFSGMLAEEVLAYDPMRAELPDPDSLIDKRFTPNPSPIEKGRALAKLAFERLPQHFRERVERGYMLRLDALREVTRRRIFVKRDILEHVWPALYDRMQRDFAGMVQFEKQIQRPESCTEEELANLRPYLQDDRLVRVLNLQPYFGHLADGPPAAVSAVPPLPASSLAIPVAAPSGPESTPPLPIAAATLSPVHQFATEQVVAPSFTELPQVNYDDVYLAVLRTAMDTYRVELTTTVTGGRQDTIRCDSVNLNWTEIRDQVRRLRFSRNVLEGQVLSAHPDFTIQLKQLGLMVYDSLFKGPIRDALLNMLGSGRNLRLHWLGDPEDPISAVLPWECLYIPPAPVSFLALTRKYSLTRRNVEAKSMPVSPIGRTLRMLFVTASPSMVAPLPSIAQEIATVHGVLASSGRAELKIVENADVERVNDIMREFRPHIFHFSGHGVFRDEAMAGELVFQTSSANVHLVAADQLAVMLYENDVSVAVLNGCDTGVSSTNDTVSSVAGALIKAGVPAVVATMREVMDEAATRFTREFYRSFLAGFTIEGSMGEARKALSLDNWDWSAYALFVGSADLNKLRVSGAARSQH
jgi:hypothetical protein